MSDQGNTTLVVYVNRISFGIMKWLKRQAFLPMYLLMKSKNWVRVLVWTAICAWPAVEIYRLQQARQELAASTKVEQKVGIRLADSRAKSIQVANKDAR